MLKPLDPDTKEVTCTHCHGTGKVSLVQSDLMTVARQAVREFPNQKIQAIKRVREVMGVSLIDAKNAVDEACKPVRPPTFASQEEADAWLEEHS